MQCMASMVLWHYWLPLCTILFLLASQLYLTPLVVASYLCVGYLTLVTVSLCVAIKEAFNRVVEDDVILVHHLYHQYGHVKDITQHVAQGIRAHLMGVLAWAGYLVMVVLATYVKDPSQENFVSGVIVRIGLFVLLIAMAAYPSILIDNADRVLRERIAHSDYTSDAGRDNVLLCLYLNADQTGLTVFGAVINKDILTLALRALYLN